MGSWRGPIPPRAASPTGARRRRSRAALSSPLPSSGRRQSAGGRRGRLVPSPPAAGRSRAFTSMSTNPYRTHTCGELRVEQAGETVRLAGWLHAVRDHRGIVFVSLRDHYGQTQVVFDASENAPLEKIKHLRLESVVSVEGEVLRRPAGTQNPELATGAIEVHARALTVLTAADQVPFHIARDEAAPEELRLRYRFLDLRRERLQRNLKVRAQAVSHIRGYMERHGF